MQLQLLKLKTQSKSLKSHVRISQKLKDEIFILSLREDEDIERFSYLH